MRLGSRRMALLLAGAFGCAHAATPNKAVTPDPVVTAGPRPSRAPAQDPGPRVPPDGLNPSATQIPSMLRQSGLEFVTLDPGRRWRVSFTGHIHPIVNVFVVYSNAFTVVWGKLFTLPDGADGDIYKAIAQRNFDLEQMKLSVDPAGEVFASFEVPTRIMDRRELVENIVSLAKALDSLDLDHPSRPPPERAPPPPRRETHDPRSLPMQEIQWLNAPSLDVVPL
jgi:hypothetical protein